MIGSIKSTPVESITLEATRSRQTPEPGSRKFAKALGQGALAILGAASSAASVLPAGGVLSAAVRAGAATAASGPRAPAPAVEPTDAGGSGIDDMWALQEAGLRDNLEVLRLQERISRDERVFTTISNVMKARHETARTAIGNIR
jgi:hypothetical protein